MKRTATRVRLASLVSVAAIGLTAIAGGNAAWAAPQDYGNIDGDRQGSLTVHKFLQQSGTTTGDLSVAPADGDFSDPVAGVQFTIYPLLVGGVPIDLTVQESWTNLQNLTPGAACTAPTGMTFGTPIVMTDTNAAGSATQLLDVGVYQVCETGAPSNIIETAQPFILTVPMPYQNGWVYDVHAYPKNAAGEIVKTIDPQEGLGLGSTVTFPVTVPVPRLGEEWTGFAIRDVLDPRLSPVDVTEVTVTVDGVALDPAFYTVVNDGQQVTFAMTPAGLTWLNEGPNAHVGAAITVNFAGVIEEIGDGTIPNTAVFFPNNPGFDPDGELPSNEVRTHWGDLGILKRAAGTSGSQGLLEGAVFEVYAAADPYAADCSAAQATGSPLSVDRKTTFTSDAAGVITINGLFVSDSENPVIDATQRCYVLKEVAAPTGYVLPADPYTPVAVQMGTVTTDNVEIENSQPGVPVLPMTGAAGQVMLGVAAVAALTIALGLVLMRRRAAAQS